MGGRIEIRFGVFVRVDGVQMQWFRRFFREIEEAEIVGMDLRVVRHRVVTVAFETDDIGLGCHRRSMPLV